MHLEEKMAEINNRLVKSYEVVQELDEDTLTSLLKKGEEIYRSSLDKLEDYRYTFHRDLTMIKEELSTIKYQIYLQTLHTAKEITFCAEQTLQFVQEISL